ncbi:MAG: dTDP-4-dehydrorhamnose reductase [Gemmatimonadaceae bacterium]|jgi:dTDP-4-dehydrorhamnose reductase|nr:dTDP-4-dehydrorhamnose reductase [Gemmatimonadaceae bacterium]
MISAPNARAPLPLQIWGGIECTVNRVGARYFDQIALSGRGDRADDIDRFAEMGIRTLRYPVLWERVAPQSLRDADWSSTDRALERMRAVGITPIIGLVHHGSGPRHTSLLDPAFPEKLGDFARAVAERYPWIEMVTPVNEPLTTARFAGLYGLWFPHARDDRSFVRALINQCLAIRNSMVAVRAVNASAHLVQTEDLGKTYSTPLLRYQAEFDNERRWLTYDLLCGRVGEDHFFWRYLLDNGATLSELESFLSDPCQPDIIGVNHYLTSERFLDDRVELYPPAVRGGNGRHAYADVEAVRVLENGLAGHLGLLRAAWERYSVPLAVTEVHLGCTREQQMRWLRDAWCSVEELREKGCDIRAITVWSLLGCFGWHTLVTRGDGRYEPGAFDLRSGEPRPTAIAAMTARLATDGSFDHPVLDGEGWWRGQGRLAYPAYHSAHVTRALQREKRSQRPILITGASGTLGTAFTRICQERGLEIRALTRHELDITDGASIESALSTIKPWAVINAAGYVRVDDAEWDYASCQRVNASGAIGLALACEARGIRLATFSTDLVFDGDSKRPYTEVDAVNPRCAYGRSKAVAESALLAMRDQPLIIRTSAFFGPWDAYNFLSTSLSAIADGVPVEAADDLIVSPTYVPDLAHTTLDLLIDDERGIWHLANSGETTWAQFAQRAAESAGLDVDLIVGRPWSALGYSALRPRYSALTSVRGCLMPSLEDALTRYTSEWAELRGTPAQTANA